MKHIILTLLFASFLASCSSTSTSNQICDPDKEVGPPNPNKKDLVAYVPPTFGEFSRHNFKFGNGSPEDRYRDRGLKW